MIISGRNAVFEAIKAGKAKKIIVRHGASVHFDDIKVPFEVLGRSVFEEKYGEETQGVAAEIDEFEYTEFKVRVKELSKEKGVVLLDKIQDPHNFGAIIRAAHCFGIKDIIVPRHDQAKVTPTVYKTSAGALLYMNIIEVVNLGQAIDALKDIDFRIVAADMNGEPLPSVMKSDKSLGIIIGAEGKGIRSSILERADNIVSIPMVSNIDSLNASMSAAVIFYEFFGK